MQKELLESYLLHKQISVNSKSKMEDITRYMTEFFEYKQDMDNLNEKDLVAFLNKIKGRLGISTQNNVKAYIKNFILWKFTDHSVRFPNLKDLLKFQKVEPTYSAEDMLSLEEVEKLIQEETNPMWKAFFLTMFYGGLRPSEAIRLEWTNIKFAEEGAFIDVYVSKTKKNYTKFVPEKVTFYIKKIQNNGSKYLFPSPHTMVNGRHKTQRPLTVDAAGFRLRTLSQKVLHRSVNLYQLRHSVATIIYSKKGVKDDDAAYQLGHTKSMREVYKHLSKEDIRNNIKAIWLEAESLPPEKKEELLNRIKELEEKMEDYEEFLKPFIEQAKEAGYSDEEIMPKKRRSSK